MTRPRRRPQAPVEGRRRRRRRRSRCCAGARPFAEENTAALVEAVAGRASGEASRSLQGLKVGKGRRIAHVDSFAPTLRDRVQKRSQKLEPSTYESELARLQGRTGQAPRNGIKAAVLKVVVPFEGRDAAARAE